MKNYRFNKLFDVRKINYSKLTQHGMRKVFTKSEFEILEKDGTYDNFDVLIPTKVSLERIYHLRVTSCGEVPGFSAESNEKEKTKD